MTPWMMRVAELLGLDKHARLNHTMYRRLESLYLLGTSEQDAANIVKESP